MMMPWSEKKKKLKKNFGGFEDLKPCHVIIINLCVCVFFFWPGKMLFVLYIIRMELKKWFCSS